MSTTGPQPTITKINGRIGAEVSGIQLAEDLTEPVVAAIKQALLDHKVVFLRDQDGLDDETLLRIGSLIGELTETAHPTTQAIDDYHQISRIDSRQWSDTKRSKERTGPNFWHTDATFVHRPPTGAILTPAVLPTYGGDTLWANTASAYAALPEALRELADRLWAVHSNRRGYADPRAENELPPTPDDERPAGNSIFWGPLYESLHPVVQVHPDSGERALLLGVHLRHILGLEAKPSHEIQDALQYYIERQENIIRWHWRLGDVAIFDNRTTQHYAVSDYGDQRRLLHRVSFKGEPPRSVDGRSSVARIGDVTTAHLPQAEPPTRDPRQEEHGRTAIVS